MCDELDLDKRFSPSQWAKRYPGSQICKEHLKYIEHHSKVVSESIPCKLNIAYGSGKREAIDIYGTNLPEDSPMLIHFHGGYWQEPSIRHDNNAFIAKHLYPKKIKLVLVGYELCPNVSLHILLENIQKALKMCLTLVDTNKVRGIHLSGHSAGAQIVAILFKSFIPGLPEELKSLFKSAFLIAGIYDLVPLLKTSYNNALKLDTESAASVSPLRQKLEFNKCEIIVAVAEYDCPELIEQGGKMYNLVKDQGFQSIFSFRKNTDHFDIVEGLYDNKNGLIKLILHYCLK